MKNNFINPNKKGTIILSSYRSGGSRLSRFVDLVYKKIYGKKADFLAEFDIDATTPSTWQRDFNKFFFNTSTRYKVVLLNNPLSISYLLHTDKFGKLVKNFHVIYLERKNILNKLLSIGLWERFIATGMYDNTNLWTKENMLKFHNDTLSNPLPYKDVYTGLDLSTDHYPERKYLNHQLLVLNNNLRVNRYIQMTFNLIKVYYEDFENNDLQFLYNNLDQSYADKVIELYIHSDRKIPYISNNYLDYYDDITKECLKAWKIK